MSSKLRYHVIDVHPHGDRVYSVILEPEDGLVPVFLPGQFLYLALDQYAPGDFWPDSRSFSIASPPSERTSLRITYAVKGEFTGRMESELHPGRQVWIDMPFGEFIVDRDSDVCLLAGGTGVTAFTAFLAGLSPQYPHRVSLFYGARCPDLLIFRDLVETSRLRCPNLQVWYLAEQDASGTDCLLGQIEAGVVFRSISSPLSVKYYIAGPPAMIASLSTGLGLLGVSPDRLVAEFLGMKCSLNFIRVVSAC